MASRVIQMGNGQFRVLADRFSATTIPAIPPLTAEEIWTARCELRRQDLAIALRKTKGPEGARLIPLQGATASSLPSWIKRTTPNSLVSLHGPGYKKARAVSMIDGGMNQMDRLLMCVWHRCHHRVRHANGNPLDNRKRNLHVLTG
jgi:hypothetical protein